MKRTIAILLALLIAATVMVGCGGGSTTQSVGAGRNVTDGTEKTPADVSTETDSALNGKNDDSITADIGTDTETESESESETEEESTSGEDTDSPEPTNFGEAIASLAKKKVGTAFELGAAGPDTFDNSGFVYYCCAQNGVTVPRLAGPMVNAGHAVSYEDLAPGDILVFSADIGGAASFLGIYIGNNQFVAAHKPGVPTEISTIDSYYWLPRLITCRRVG